MQHFQGEPRNFIDLLTYCRDGRISEEKLEESVQRLLSVGNDKLTIEKLRALLGNEAHPENLYREDNICIMAKQQLSELTALMHQMN
jgi:sigma54-dependent transcription regulator